MISLVEPLICPCCLSALLHALSQCVAPPLFQPLLQLRSSSLYAAIGLQFGFVFVGVAEPALFAKAQAEGKMVLFSNHNSNFQVDLNAISFGTKVASVMSLELLQN